MAKDPKNFTGEDVPALLAEHARHQRSKDSHWMVWVTAWAMVPVGIFLISVIALVASWVR